MYEVELINAKTGEQFVKKFNSLFLCRKFVEKCRHSKKLIVLFHPNFME